EAGELTDEVRRESSRRADQQYLRRQVSQCLNQSRWAEAVALLDILLGESPDAADDLRSRGRAHAELSHWDQATADYVRALDLLPQNRYRDSPWSAACGQVAKSDELFTRVTALRPDYDTLWVARGRWLASSQKWAGAVDCFARVIDRQPLPDRNHAYDEVYEYP